MNLEWRIIDTGEREGSFNTAIDVALLESVGNNESKPAIVMTEWKPTVSLGNSQSYFLDVDEKACKKHNVQVVRRRSGGQAVFLDNNYFVFSVIAKPDMFPKDLTLLRKWFCNMVVEMLTDYDVPVEFYQPDNIVIRNGDKFRTIGNSGQVITSKAIAVHGSVRYSLKNLDVMTDVLKVNGQKLQQFEEEKEGLKIKSISTRGELDEFEQHNIEKAIEWVEIVGPKLSSKSHTKVVVCPSFSSLEGVKKVTLVNNFPIAVGCQDVSAFPSGAYTGEEAAENLIREIESKAPVDRHLADQILPFMALTKGSKVKVSEITSHCKTNIYAIEQFLGKIFELNETEKTIAIIVSDTIDQ